MKIRLTTLVPIDGLEWGAGSVLDLAPVLAQAYLSRGVAELIEDLPRKAVLSAPETPESPEIGDAPMAPARKRTTKRS